MKYYICPNCGCINELTKNCAGCGLDAFAVNSLLEFRRVHALEFESVEKLDAWIELARKHMGAKVWRKKNR